MISAPIFGSILILIGIALLLNSLFGIVIPVFRILAGVCLIYWGITTIVDISEKNNKINTLFAQKHISTLPPLIQTYNTIFGASTLDLSNEALMVPSHEIAINTVCGSSRIIIPSTINYEISASGALSSMEFPDGKAIRGFGSTNSSRINAPGHPTLRLTLHGALSSVLIEEKNLQTL